VRTQEDPTNKARRNFDSYPADITITGIELSAAIVCTLSLWAIPDSRAAIDEMKRVLAQVAGCSCWTTLAAPVTDARRWPSCSSGTRRLAASCLCARSACRLARSTSQASSPTPRWRNRTQVEMDWRRRRGDLQLLSESVSQS
jgi:hypothetical protein